jgi:hypothetical protein
MIYLHQISHTYLQQFISYRHKNKATQFLEGLTCCYFTSRLCRTVSSSGMWRHVVCWNATDVSEEHIASIFRFEENISASPASKQLATCLLAGIAEMFSSNLKMEAICSSETSDASQQTIRRHIPEDDTLHNYSCENLESYKIV